MDSYACSGGDPPPPPGSSPVTAALTAAGVDPVTAALGRSHSFHCLDYPCTAPFSLLLYRCSCKYTRNRYVKYRDFGCSSGKRAFRQRWSASKSQRLYRNLIFIFSTLWDTRVWRYPSRDVQWLHSSKRSAVAGGGIRGGLRVPIDPSISYFE